MADTMAEHPKIEPAPPGAAYALLLDALSFAAHQHRDQRRKNADASPYINHPIAVAQILCSEAAVDDVETLCAALLHDTIEDTETTARMLTEKFGRVIACAVAEVTDDKSLAPQERKRSQVEHASTLSSRAGLIKLADKIANLRDVADDPPASWDLEKKRGYFDWAKQVVDRLRGRHAELERLFDAAYAKRP